MGNRVNKVEKDLFGGNLYVVPEVPPTTSRLISTQKSN